MRDASEYSKITAAVLMVMRRVDDTGTSAVRPVVYLRGVFDGYKVQLGGLEVRLSTSTPTDLKSQPF